jgi:coenzyme F420-0:L-glutamate ligase/coenzyme F420-1:gamma-L-glutamate ligase
VPIVGAGTDLGAVILSALVENGIELRSNDVVVLASKIVSRSEGRYVDLGTITASDEARRIAADMGKDPRFVELVLRETVEVSRRNQNAFVVKNRLGVVCANAGIDGTNARPLDAPPGSGPFALLLPEDPDGSAECIRRTLVEKTGASVGVVITDSVGRPFRFGTVGIAVGVAGLPALWDQRGRTDLFGTRLEQTITALADQVAAAADLVAGQAAEGRAVVHVRGLAFRSGEHSARELVRPSDQDLYVRPTSKNP